MGDSYKAGLVAAEPHALAQSVGPGRCGLGEGTATHKGATGFGISSALRFLTDMGHARRRPKRLAEKLLQIRETLGLSQREIAGRIRERAGVEIPYKNISKYELGKSTPPMEIALAYARLAGISLEHIVDDEIELEV